MSGIAKGRARLAAKTTEEDGSEGRRGTIEKTSKEQYSGL
jgi:hypothetical protein